MLVCHCNVISTEEIEDIIVGLLDEDPWRLVVPAVVFHALEARGKCCGCLPSMVETIIRVVERYHADMNTADERVIDLTRRLANIGEGWETKRHARQRQGNRAA